MQSQFQGNSINQLFVLFQNRSEPATYTHTCFQSSPLRVIICLNYSVWIMESFHLASEGGKYFRPETVFLKNMHEAVNLMMHSSHGSSRPGAEGRGEPRGGAGRPPAVCVPSHPGASGSRGPVRCITTDSSPQYSCVQTAMKHADN